LLTPRHQLEDFNSATPLYPTVPKLKANCRLWVDFVWAIPSALPLLAYLTNIQINTRIVPAFYSVLTASYEEPKTRGMEKLHRHISDLVQAAGEKVSLPHDTRWRETHEKHV
jgi:hypothetical protein